ncbi:MAG: hypothetical protein RBR50_08405 [Candidatus Izemoplasmatales bacterium]|nr:hypothetical protein [Candidatus Izemoplasmatales bacterium]
MKEKKFTITMIVLLLAIALFFIMLILLGNSDIYNQRIFLLKHSTYFIFITLITVALLYLFYHLINRHYLERGYNILYLKLFTLVVFGITLFITSSLRIDYIEKYETPIVTYFVLYDDYNNRIYDSTLKRSEVDIQIIEKSDFKLTLEVIEKSDGLTYKYVDGEVSYEIPLQYESRSLIDIKYNDNNMITDYVIKQEFVRESNDLGNKAISQLSRIFIMENEYSRYSFTSNRKTRTINTEIASEGYYDFNETDLSESSISASYDENFEFVNFYLYDHLEIPLYSVGNDEINFAYSPTNESGLIDDFGFVDFNNDNIVTLLSSPLNKRGELVEYSLKKNLFLTSSIKNIYNNTSDVDYNYQENINDAYLFGTRYYDNEVLEYVQIDTTEFGYKTTFFRYLEKDTTSSELRWLYEQTPTFSGEKGVNIYFNYYENFYNYYGKKDYHYIIFEENPVYDIFLNALNE